MKITNDILLPQKSVELQKPMEADKTFAEVLESAQSNSDNEEIKKAAQQMEAIFINKLFSEMRKTVPEGGLLGEQSFGTKIFQGMFDQEVSTKASLSGGIGLAELIYKQMIRD